MRARIHNPVLSKAFCGVAMLLLLLLVASQALRHIAIYERDFDELITMQNVGWTGDGDYSWFDVVDSLLRNSPNQSPFYYLLLNSWGHFVGTALATGRVLSVFFHLLAICLMYRFCSEFFAREAGLCAAAILASNAFYNFYVAQLRFYPLTILLIILAYWAYLRLLMDPRPPMRRGYLALFILFYALLNTYALSAWFFASIAIYHLLFVRKDKRWLQIGGVGLAAFLLYSPWILSLFSTPQAFVVPHVAPPGGKEALWTVLGLMTNNVKYLLLPSALGLLLLARKQLALVMPFTIPALIFLLLVFMSAELAFSIIRLSVRYYLPGFVLIVAFAASGLYGLFAFRRWVGLLAIFWVIAGLAYQQDESLYYTVHIRARVSNVLPWSQVGAIVADQGDADMAVLWFSDTHVASNLVGHYFDNNGAVFHHVATLPALDSSLPALSAGEQVVLLVVDQSYAQAGDLPKIERVVESGQFARCSAVELPRQVLVQIYRPDAADCVSTSQ